MQFVLIQVHSYAVNHDKYILMSMLLVIVHLTPLHKYFELYVWIIYIHSNVQRALQLSEVRAYYQYLLT